VTCAAQTDEQRRAERRARREARREKQRAENVHRAAQMHDARRHHVGDSVPSDRDNSKLPRLIVGCSGWYYWHWKGAFYPSELPGKDWFSFYSSKFRTVELNAPFYSWPTVATVKTWLRQAKRRRFVYTIKVNELMTHRKRMIGTKTLVQDFYHIADLLGGRMGCFLFQFPPSFKYSKAALKRIVTQLDAKHRNVVEFRHQSWWNSAVYSALRDAGIVFCSCSGPRLPDELVKTSDEIYVRFHGSTRWYRHDYTKEELAIWAQRIRDSGAKRVWAYFNNDRNCYAIKNARELIRQLKRLDAH
jgi:uncharacterized protein YecE (DUF72 family)